MYLRRHTARRIELIIEATGDRRFWPVDRSPLHLYRKWNLSRPPLPTGNGTGQPSIRTGKISLHPCSTYPFSPLSFQPFPIPSVIFVLSHPRDACRFHCLWNYVRKGWKGEKINYFFDLRDEQKNLFQIYGFIVNLMICNFVVLFFIMAINYQNIIFLSSQKVISSFKYFEHVATIGQKNS